MAKILLSWESGGGLGHLLNLRPLARGLSERGHRVFAALRDLSRAEFALGSIASYLQAPSKFSLSASDIEPPQTFAHILHNIGFGDLRELSALTTAWRHLFEYVQPDLVVFDHSPTALLALRGFPAKRALIGTGFFCPLPSDRLPNLRPWLPADLEKLARDEVKVQNNANEMLIRWGQRPLERITELYEAVDESFLVTFKELDHYADRVGATYRGAWSNVEGDEPVWPKGEGKRIFAYLKSFPALGELLRFLRESGHPTLVHIGGLPTKIKSRFSSDTLWFADRPLDMHRVSERCDLAILNGTHGSTVAILLAGKPSLQIPIFLEQGIFAQTVVGLGAALSAAADNGNEIIDRLTKILSSDQYTAAAQAFAAHYKTFDVAASISGVVNRAEELAMQGKVEPP